jgi:hypothetical protein
MDMKSRALIKHKANFRRIHARDLEQDTTTMVRSERQATHLWLFDGSASHWFRGPATTDVALVDFV